MLGVLIRHPFLFLDIKMSNGLQPYFDMLADFMVAVDFPNNFKAPLNLLSTDAGDFALIPAVEQWLYQETGRITLAAKDVDSQSDPAGLLLRRKNSAEIQYSAELNTCWKRFVVAKEIAHLVIEEIYGDAVIDVKDLLNSVSLPKSQGIYGCYDIEDARGLSELLAVFIAEYLLVPWFATDDIRTSNKTPQQLAVEYRVPVYLIEIRQLADDDQLLRDIKDAYERRLAQINS